MEQLAARNPQKEDRIERILSAHLSVYEQKHCCVEGIRNQTLLLKVDSPVWLYNIRQKQQKMLSQFAEDLKDITQIKFIIGKIDDERQK